MRAFYGMTLLILAAFGGSTRATAVRGPGLRDGGPRTASFGELSDSIDLFEKVYLGGMNNVAETQDPPST